jgi:predicted transcriptional regulator
MRHKRNDEVGLRERRRAVGCTQQRLAQLADCSIAYIQVLEYGVKPNPAKAPQYAAILRTLDELERQAAAEEVNATAA